VYDVTSFVALHPGGTKILLAAGKELAPFWELYNVHKSEEVQEMLEEMCIGELAPGEMEKRQIVDLSDPFALEPLRNKELIPSSQRPFNAEPPINYLVESRLTPNDLFFTRNHLAVPSVDISTYQLEVSGVGLSRSGLTFKLDDIKQFPKYTVEATLQCAGNRRSELTDVKPVKGLRWGIGAISNATWSGARLLDVLKAAGACV
jgi:sulfite oxidase